MDTDRVEAAWRDDRRRVMDVAYRLLGSLRDAEDVVGEAYARLAASELDSIVDTRGWLVTVTGRLCLDRLRSAEATRRAYLGPWLPEPIVDLPGSEIDPADRVTLDDTVRMALLVVLEQLSPAERTTFVLHDVFGLSFDEVAELVGRTPAACRQLAVRARRRIEADDTARNPVDAAEQRRVAHRFARACASGDVDALVAVLDPDVVGDFDSGGRIPDAPLRPVRGTHPVARLLERSLMDAGCDFGVADVNGEPGVVVRRAGRLVAVIVIGVSAGRVDHVHGIGNPDKLRGIGSGP
jgi:RNA polymerase sigma-70 factor, ECF subfamily